MIGPTESKIPFISPLDVLHESEQKVVGDVAFEPPEELSQVPQRPYGAMTPRQFSEASRAAVKECVRTIEEGLVKGLDMMRIYTSLEHLLSRLCQNLAQQAGVAHFREFGAAREDDFNNYLLTGMGKGMHHQEEGRQLIQWLSQRPLSPGRPSLVERRGSVTFLGQLFTPEVYKEKTTSLANKISKNEELSLSDHVVINILDTCISLNWQLSANEIEGTINRDNTQIQAKRALSNPSETMRTFYVGRVTAETSLSTKVNLSTYIATLNKDGDSYVPGDTVAVLHPHPAFLLSIRLQSMVIFKQIIEWDRRKSEPLSHLITQFSSLYGQAFSQGKGSTWCCEVLIRAFHHFHGFRLVEPRGIALALRTVITPYFDDLLPHFAALSVQQDFIPKAISNDNKYLAFSPTILKSKFKSAIEQRVQLHRDCLDLLIFRFAQRHNKMRTKVSATTSNPNDFFKLTKALILEKERDFQTLQLNHWQTLQNFASSALDSKTCSDMAMTLDSCRNHNIRSHLESTAILHTNYLSEETKSYLLLCRRIHGPLPHFIEGEEFESIKNAVEEGFALKKIIFPIHHIALEPLADITNATPEELNNLREKAYREHVQVSGHHMYFERYITPDGERNFVWHPVTIAIDNTFMLVKVYATNYPALLPFITVFDKAREHFSAMLDEELPALGRLTNMLAALKNNLDQVPKVEAAAAKPPSSKPPGTAYTAIDALLYSNNQHSVRKPKKAELPEDIPAVAAAAPSPAVAAPPPPTPVKIYTLKSDDDYRVFLIIMGLEKDDVTWNEVKKCFAALEFSILPKGGKIYQFKFEKASALIQEEGAAEFFARASKNFHEPHINKKYTARTPLPHPVLERFKELLLKAGMNADTVKLQRG